MHTIINDQTSGDQTTGDQASAVIKPPVIKSSMIKLPVIKSLESEVYKRLFFLSSCQNQDRAHRVLPVTA